MKSFFYDFDEKTHKYLVYVVLQQQFHGVQSNSLEIVFKVFKIDDNSHIDEVYPKPTFTGKLVHQNSKISNKFHFPLNK